MRAKTLVLFSCLITVSLVTVSGTGVAKNGPQYYGGGGGIASETWTFALYVAGDNNLEKYWDDVSLASLLRLPANDAFTIVAFVDRLSTEGTEVLEISGDSYEVVQAYDEKNFGEGATFQWFLEEVRDNYVSDKLAVVAWDHGYAWRYICDDVSQEGRITMPAFEEAIVNAGVYIDLLAFDACNMASIEVVYQVGLTGLVGVVVASEESVPTPGLPYDLMLAPTVLDTSRSPAELATDMVLGFQEFYEPQTWASTVALSAVSVPALMESSGTIRAWVDSVHECLPEYAWNYKLALMDAYFAWCTHYHVDIADMGVTLLADPAITDEGLRAATEDMVAAIDGAVFANWGGRAAEDSRGLTLWWGVGGEWKFGCEAYAEVAFAQDMGWWDFLDDYN